MKKKYKDPESHYKPVYNFGMRLFSPMFSHTCDRSNYPNTKLVKKKYNEVKS